jgi:hypothetical protein
MASGAVFPNPGKPLYLVKNNLPKSGARVAQMWRGGCTLPDSIKNRTGTRRSALLPSGNLASQRPKTEDQRGLDLETARSLILILLVVTPVLAQSHLPSEILPEVRTESNEIQSTTNYLPAVAAPTSLPDTPAPHRARVIDKKFIAVMGALGGAESLRFTTHKLVLDHEFEAGAPWVTSVPPNQHLIAKYAAIYAAELLVAYEIKKPHSWLPGDRIIRKLWWVYPAAMIPIHVKNGIRSMRTQSPSCPVEECESQ